MNHFFHEEYLQKLYANRFDIKQRKAKTLLWETLINNFLQQYVSRDSITLDIGGGYCEFINQIQSKEKYLVDLNPDALKYANSNVKVLRINILDI